jgi:hypothetical protein
MDDFTNDEVQARYREELGQGLSDFFDRVLVHQMTIHDYKVPEKYLDIIGDLWLSYDRKVSLDQEMKIITLCLVDGLFSKDLFELNFPIGPLVEIYPAEYATKAEYGYILTETSKELINGK